MRPQRRFGGILLLGLSPALAGGCIADVEPTAAEGGPGCAGLARTCGPAGDESCCAGPSLPAGFYSRTDLDQPSAPPQDVSVSAFRLDRFEVTVGRFRSFVDAYPGSKPQPKAGAHPAMPETSGWIQAWDDILPKTQKQLIEQVSTFCDENFGGQGYPTWSEDGANDNLPMNCLSWYVAFAFCAWDGGRLPTEAEWQYAAAGGDEQRSYPWGEETPDPDRVVFECRGDGSPDCGGSDIAKVGSRSPAGDSRWGQADMAGNMFEWTLDVRAPYGVEPCIDCATLEGGTLRVVRGGAWFEVESGDEVYLRSDARNQRGMTDVLPDLGVRCAREP